MSYTVLARKWRPKNFSELVGQSHVMQALSNALDQQRLHHAYLFTGTRGVGKTTIARIFAKALNCQEGISSTPCGVCETCRSIDEGRFIDLIEVDAASKTKVDDTREILDNVQFAPTQGRYKVYLIDEVHMLSKSSFNALLKTLEEPPEHVKFLLATTDPHKLPITVLSRCLQFNLMRLTQPQIQGHLAHILQQEQVPYEDSALALIAKSADGSARDGLSLLDQSIAYGAGEVMFEPVQTMLGLVDQQFGVAILQALADDDAQQIKQVITQLATMGVDYQALLSQLIESLHAISYVQVFGDNETTTLLPIDIVQNFASRIDPERVQLLYQIALLTKQDMQLAPDLRIGFEMSLMRMLAFQPAIAGSAETQSQSMNSSGFSTSKPVATPSASQGSELSPQEVLSSLASARSLVGKKKTSISDTHSASVEPESTVLHNEVLSANETNVEVASDNETRVKAVSTRIDVSQDQHEAPNTVNEPSLSGTYSNASNSEDSVKPESSAPIDHLAQIRERLKQPLSKTVASNNITSSAVTKREPTLEYDINNNLPNPEVIEPQQGGAETPIESSVSSVQINQQDTPPWDVEQAFSSNENATASLASQVDEQVESRFLEQAPVDSTFKQQSSVSPQSVVVEPEQSSNGDSSHVESPEVSVVMSGNALQDWVQIIKKLGLKGMAEDMARNSVLVELNDMKLVMSIDPEQQYAKPEMILEQIEAAVKKELGSHVILDVIEANEHFTPVKYEQQIALDKQSNAQEAIAKDGLVNSFISTLGMEVIPGSIKPI